MIEVIDFYPVNQNSHGKVKRKIVGTMHIYIPQFHMDIRGVLCIKSKGWLIFKLPHFRTWNNDEKKMISYPHIEFTKEDMKKTFFELLYKKGNEYVKEKHPEIFRKKKPKRDKKTVSTM